MKIGSKYKLEGLASAGRFHDVYLSIKHRDVISTNGGAMAFVAVDLDTEDCDGAIQVEAIKASRKNSGTLLVEKNEVRCGGVSFTRPESKLPYVDAYRELLAENHTDPKTHVTLYLDPHLLVKLADAMGVKKEEGVMLTFPIPKSDDPRDPVVVRPYRPSERESARGVLMPMKRPPT